MSSGLRRSAFLLVALGMALALPAAQRPDPARAEADLRKLTENIQRVQRQQQQAAVEKDRLSRELRDSERAVSSARSELGRLQAERAERASARKKLEAERTAREEDRQRTEADLARQLRAAYFMGRNEPLKLLLNQRSPGEFSRSLAYYGYLGRLRADQISKIAEDVARIEQLTAEIAAEDTRLADLQAAQEKRVGELNTALKSRGRVLVSLEREATNRNAALRRMRQERSQLENLLKDLRRATKALPYDPDAPFAQTRGRLNWPIAGKLTVNYGATISGLGKAQFVEIDTKLGAEITAIHEGRVIFADWVSGRGQVVIIDHGNGYWSLYGHLAQFYSAEGSKVRGGQVIGTAGESGGRKEPGLYFELRRNEAPIDPRPWFRSAAPPAR